MASDFKVLENEVTLRTKESKSVVYLISSTRSKDNSRVFSIFFRWSFGIFSLHCISVIFYCFCFLIYITKYINWCTNSILLFCGWYINQFSVNVKVFANKKKTAVMVIYIEPWRESNLISYTEARMI